MFRNMLTSFMLHEQYETTAAKAKDLKRLAEMYITLARNDTLAGRRKAYSYLKSEAAVKKLFTQIGPRFKNRNGGYLSMVKTRRRAGDAAEMAFIRLTDDTVEAKQ